MRILRILCSTLAVSAVALAFQSPSGRCLITTATTLPAGTVNIARSYQIATEGCESPRRFDLDGGTLPPGMTLNAVSGIVAGQPSAAGLYSFTVRVLDRISQVPAKTFVLRINTALQIDRRILASAGASGSAYSDQISVSGGVAPYTFALTGSLPSGLSLSSSTNAITGTIGAGFTTPASFSVQVSDSSSPANTVTSAFQISPNATRSLATLTLPNGTQGVAYNTTVSLATGTGGSFLLANGALPAGLSLNPTTGVLSGTPTASGSFWFTVQSRLISGGTVSSAWRTYNVLISNLTGLQFTTGANPPRVATLSAYRALLSPVGGVAPFSYSLSGGALPPGVTLDTATGLLHGDVAYTETPSYSATFQVTDSRGATATQAFTFLTVFGLSFSEFSMPSGMVGSAYTSSTPATSNGGATISFGLYPFGAELPPGLTFNPTTGVFSGTPTTRGQYSIALFARDELGGYSTISVIIEIYPALTFQSTSPLPDYAASGGVQYFANVGASGGAFPSAYQVISGALPSGIVVNNLYGFLTGSSTAIGAYSFTIRVTDGNGRTATRAFTMNVVPTVAVATGALSNGIVGQSYSSQAVAQGAPTTFQYTVSSGTLPPGLSLAMFTGVLSGNPTTAGTYDFNISAARADGLGTSNIRAFRVIISNTLAFVTTSPLPSGGVGHPYSFPLQITGGLAPYSFSLNDSSLPAGLTLNPDTGIVSGVPLVAGNFFTSLRVDDPNDIPGLRSFDIVIGPEIQFSTPRLPNGTRTSAYSQTVVATGGTGALTYSLASGTLPNGVTLNGTSGALTGTPTVANTFTFTIRAADTLGVSTTQAYTVVIAEPLTFVTASPIPAAALNASYAQAFTTAGGRGAVGYTVLTNAPPAIMGMAPSTGSYGGFPIVPGTYSITVQARDADGRTVQNAFQHTVGGPPILSGILPAGTVGQSYSQGIPFTGGLAPYVVSLLDSTLPAGLTLNASTGVISGTPTLAGTTALSVLVVDATGLENIRAYTLQIYNPLVLTPATLPNGTSGTAYNSGVSTTGAVGAVTFAVGTGSLPPGITLNASTGALTGTPTTPGGNTFTITATDTVPRTVGISYTVTIASGLVISTTSLPSGIAGLSYSALLQVQGNAGATTFAVTTGSLPGGLILNSTSGVISGTPTATGSTFTITATDAQAQTAQRSFTITISPSFLITTTTLPGGAIGTAYSATIQTQNSRGVVTFQVLTGTLPAGLTLNANTGVISGTPISNGPRTFTIRATDTEGIVSDSGGPSFRSVDQIAERTYTTTIGGAFSISTTSLPNGAVSTPYSATIQSLNGNPAVTFAVTTGALPAGLTLNSNTGVISGTPTATGSTFTITATDAQSQTAPRSFTITISPAFIITTATLPDGAIGTAYSATIQTQNSQGVVTFQVLTGTLPAGLTLNTNTGVISGTPTLNGPRTFTIRATDSEVLTGDAGGPSLRSVDQIAERTYTVTIGGAFSISTTSLPNGNVSTLYSTTIQTLNGNPPVTFAVTTGTLPAGLTLNASTGVISGTPTTAGSNTFTVTATDAQSQTAPRSLTIVISGAFSFTTSTLPNGAIGVAYSATLQTQNSQAQVTYQVVQGSLPPGLTLNGTSGLISGTPTQNGSNTFTVRATDASSPSFLSTGKPLRSVDQIAEVTFTLTIGGTFAITTTALPSGTVTTSYSATLGTENAAGTVSFQLTTGTLPSGLTLVPATGVISGTPTVSGSFPFTVTATDSQQRTATRDLTITVLPRFVITTTALPNGTRGIAYDVAIETQGAVGTASFELLSGGSLPPGLTLNGATGAISGTPTQVGTSSFLIRAADSANPQLRNASVSLSITVNPSLLSITTSGLPRATAGVAYSQTLAATGGVAPYQWTIASGGLPPNLTLSTATGALAGVVQRGGVANFTVRVTDSVGITAERPFTLETVTQLGIAGIVFPIEQGQFFSSAVTVFGGRPPYQVTVLSGGPPPGISFSSSNSAFSGTTSAAPGQFSAVVQAIDSLEQVITATLLFNVAPAGPAPLGITPATVPNGLVGAAYGAQLGTSGGTPPYSFRISQGNLPPGITMNGAGTFSGTPSLAGSFTFGVLATDGGSRSAGQLFTILVTAPVAPLAVTPESVPGGSLNQPYSANLGASGGFAPYRFSLTGDLPPGVVFTSSGTLVGTPTATGTFRFTLDVTDARNVRVTLAFTITILGQVAITTASLRDAVVGAPYGSQVEAAGGTAPYTFGLSGLPPGLSGNSNGAISGTPTAAGAFAVAAEVTDARGQRSARVLSLTVVVRPTITSSPGATPVAVGQPISGGFAAAGGRPPYQWAITSGALPPGIGFVSSTGALSGTPTVEGTFAFGVTVTDSLQNTATGSATIRVLPQLTVNATTPPGGVVGAAYGAGVGASGGQGPYTFSVTEGALPPGISLGADGSLNGTPSAVGGFAFTIQATDAIGNRSTRSFSIAIGLPPVPPINFVGTPPTIQTGQQGTITVQIAASYPVPITGTLTLQFTPNATNPIDDPAVQLTSGGREVTFTIPAGATNAQFPLDPLRFQVGTVAGQVQLQTTFTPLGGQPTPGPTVTVTIPRAVPVITAASLAPASGGFALTVEGFSNTREASTMTLQFNPAPGSSLETATVTVPVTAAFNTWFNSGGSQPFGGSFRLTLPLTVTGELSAVDSVVVRLTNSVGESQPATARRN